MSPLPFILVGMLNGVVVGCAAGLVARALADGDGAIRFRDTSALGMIGALCGSVVATAINSEGVVEGPSSLLFSVAGAVFALVVANLLRRRTAQQLTRS